MLPDDQPTVPTRPPDPSRSSPPGVWVAPSIEELQAALPQYEVIDILGRGGMGAVYKARQKSLKRLVAIKILPLGMADDEFKFVERFQNEAQTMAQMNHPAIVSVYDFGETTDGLLYFVMEFVDGTDVHKMIQASGRLSGDYALAITAHVCDALSYAHKRGVIHRDIKPANILIDQEGHIKVADFGLAKMNDPAQTSGLTKTNMAMGTPDYVAPEVLVTGMVADHRADIYAVGVMLYQMLTGEVPRGMFKLPSQKGFGSDERFDAIICKAMEQDRDERYQSAMDVRRDLDVILTTPQPNGDGTGIVPVKELPQHPPADQPPPSPLRSDAGTPVRAQNPPTQGSEGQNTTGKIARSTNAWLAVGGIAAVLGIAAFFVFGGKSKTSSDVASSNTTSASEAAKPQPPIQVSENPPPASATDKTIDLLPLIDVKRDAITGDWNRDGGDLIVKAAKPGSNGTPRLQLPYQPPEEYDFEIEFTPENGTSGTYQILSASQRSFAWVLDAKLSAGVKAGFDRIDGQIISGRTVGTTMKPKFLTNGQRHRSTVEVRKTSVCALLDGELLVTYSKQAGTYQTLDSSPNEAMRDKLHLGLAAYDRGVRYHKLTVREISGAGKLDAVVSREGLPNLTNWQDATSTLRDYAKAKPGVAIEGDLITWTGEKQSPPHFTVTPAGQNDYAIRLTHVGAGQINVRMNEKGFVYVQSAPSGLRINRWMKGVVAPVTLMEARDIPFSYSAGDPHVLTVTVQGSTIRAWLDGQLMGTVEDKMFAEGTGAVALVSYGKVQKVEIAELKDEAASAKAVPPAAAANWQDVTSILRESVAKKTGYTVDVNGVKRAEDAATADTMVMGPNEKDRAVRVRYIAQAQVSLWFKGGSGSAYVLAARDRVMIKRQTQKIGEADSMLPSVMHPTGFDPAQPHELAVAVQGAVVRAWLDGNFIGEVEDAALKECSMAVVPMGSATIQKVEAGELPDASSAIESSSAGWQPIFNQPSDFGGDMRDDVEFRDGATFIKARTFLAPADSAIVGIRSTMRYLTGGDRTGSLTLRSTEAVKKYGEEDFGLTAFIAPKGTSLVVKMRDRPAGISELGRHDFPLTPGLNEGELFTFELRAENKKITVSINGHEVGSLDDAWTGPTRHFGITPSVKEMTEFRDVAVRRSKTP